MSNEMERINGTMVRNLKEMKENGKVMESMKTNQQINEEGMEPDPKQENVSNKNSSLKE
ncbi:hypothetical protein [Bacillus sp. S/N-304-OC-R1]|uniref:hypothetical protein n=1 Tax=Bacillus sp. S/N-304-OC-R1 TaxID=2758034 RepID=UPI001C8D9F96|nr:hypothetical protein [Bacillus sp. S/N-304-OC-R1]MBY0121793.1 hypothetical protein [Bacillus sp. S/N-304-OC-R1]